MPRERPVMFGISIFAPLTPISEMTHPGLESLKRASILLAREP